MVNKKPKLIYLEWVDASGRSGWFNEGSLIDWEKHGKVLVKSVGFFIKETKDYIYLSIGFHPENDYTDEQYLNMQRVPKGWIKKKKELKI